MTRKVSLKPPRKKQLISARNAERNGIVFSNVPAYGADDIRKLRQRYGISQAILAKVLNTTVAAVGHWEHGIRQPSGPTSKLLYMLDVKGLDALL